MQQSYRKLKRVAPLIKAKEARLDQEAAILAAIRREKMDAATRLRESQRIYMEGVERLNRERKSTEREMLLPLEQSLDHVRERWHSDFRKVQEIEKREELQVAQLVLAQQNLKSFERLRDKYKRNFQEDLAKDERKQLDEIALRRFSGVKD